MQTFSFITFKVMALVACFTFPADSLSPGRRAHAHLSRRDITNAGSNFLKASNFFNDARVRMVDGGSFDKVVGAIESHVASKDLESPAPLSDKADQYSNQKFGYGETYRTQIPIPKSASKSGLKDIWLYKARRNSDLAMTTVGVKVTKSRFLGLDKQEKFYHYDLSRPFPGASHVYLGAAQRSTTVKQFMKISPGKINMLYMELQPGPWMRMLPMDEKHAAKILFADGGQYAHGSLRLSKDFLPGKMLIELNSAFPTAKHAYLIQEQREGELERLLGIAVTFIEDGQSTIHIVPISNEVTKSVGLALPKEVPSKFLRQDQDWIASHVRKLQLPIAQYLKEVYQVKGLRQIDFNIANTVDNEPGTDLATIFYNTITKELGTDHATIFYKPVKIDNGDKSKARIEYDPVGIAISDASAPMRMKLFKITPGNEGIYNIQPVWDARDRLLFGAKPNENMTGTPTTGWLNKLRDWYYTKSYNRLNSTPSPVRLDRSDTKNWVTRIKERIFSWRSDKAKQVTTPVSTPSPPGPPFYTPSTSLPSEPPLPLEGTNRLTRSTSIGSTEVILKQKWTNPL